MKTPFLSLLAAFVLSPSVFAQIPPKAADSLPFLQPGSIVIFQGDSITDGGRARSGDDHNHTMGQDYAYMISARLGAQLPERHLTFLNRGIGGNKLSDLIGRWSSDTLNLKPDLLSILIGINDSQAHTPMDVFEKSYDKLLADTVAALPHVRLVLCEPFILPVGKFKDNFDAWQADVKQRAAIVEKLALKYHAPVVRLQPILDAACQRAPAQYWLWDGIHPDYHGHYLLAEEWIRTVSEFYGKAMAGRADLSKGAASPVNTAIVPVSRLEIDSYDWFQRHDAILAQQKALNPEVVLIGDSITHFWAGEPRARTQNGPVAWATTFGAKRVLNMGFGWDRTQNVLWRLDHGELDGLNPGVVILNIGTNNFSDTVHARANTPAEIAEGIEAICARIRARCPTSKIIVMGVFPRGGSPTDGRRPGILALNQILAQKLAMQPNLTFLDIGTRLMEPDGSITREVLADGTHPAEKGYSIWGAALQETGVLQ